MDGFYWEILVAEIVNPEWEKKGQKRCISNPDRSRRSLVCDYLPNHLHDIETELRVKAVPLRESQGLRELPGVRFWKTVLRSPSGRGILSSPGLW